jgi:hypothetical protein
VGAWGPGPFENDDALDLVGDVSDNPTWERMTTFLGRVASHAEYLEAPDGSRAVAVAALVCGQAPEGSEDLLARLGPPPAKAGLHVVAALNRVLAEHSELDELWRETDEHEAWRATVAQLQAKLGTD